MIEQILMGASAVITLSACYCGWHYAKQAQGLAEALATARSQRNATLLDCISLEGERDRLSDLVAKFQAKKPLRTSDGKFASKRAAKTAELREYVASKAVS